MISRPHYTLPHCAHAVVAGLGVSGMAAARLLKSQGVRVTGMDEKAGDMAPVPEALDALLDHFRPETLCQADLIVVSPGLDPFRPELEAARKKGIPIIGELALGLRYLTLPLVVITGTNGKSTVTELISAMLMASGKKVFAGGNLGTPLCDFVQNPGDADIAVLEVSSFQLDTLETLAPDVAVLLNITEDHLDRYGDMDAYTCSKARLFKDMKKGVAILNYKDSRVRIIGEGLDIPVLWYDRADSGLVITEETLHTEDGTLFRIENFSLPGRHNRENLAAALLAARAAGASDTAIQDTIDRFQGLEHRMTFCGHIGDVACYDDSKATNIDAVCRALMAFDRPVVLIMGGRDKGGDYRLMLEPLVRYAKALVLIGEAADAIQAAIGSHIPCEKADSLEEAVRKAAHAADAETPVLLSPACSSFDMFRNYKDRGMQFRSVVALLGASGKRP